MHLANAPAVLLELDPTHLIRASQRQANHGACQIQNRNKSADYTLTLHYATPVLLELDPTHHRH